MANYTAIDTDFLAEPRPGSVARRDPAGYRTAGIEGKRMHKTCYSVWLVVCLSLVFGPSRAQVPSHAEGLKEELIVVDLGADGSQSGVLSVPTGTTGQSRLAVLLPGYPSVVRPVIENGAMVRSKLNGNFLIRSRKDLADSVIATLVVDCYSQSGDYCSSAYQSSPQRQLHVQKLVDEVKRRIPTIEQVWLIGTSMGTISSSFMPKHAPGLYKGAIHTASITEPFARNSYRELADFDYRQIQIPQFLIHHKNDPCYLTTWSGAKSISDKYGIALISVTGGSDFRGAACQAFTEHGFRGKEKEVMQAISVILKTGQPASLTID